jgi:hypothetical protein
MPIRRLIVCNDGTWNTPDQEDNGIPSPTNVVRLKNSIMSRSSDGVEQMVYYHPGVGTAGKVDAVMGGALGRGVDEQIMSACHWLGENYREGDEIFIFGFSRGAFVARSLAGFIGRGLPRLVDVDSKTSWSFVDAAFKRGYRRHARGQDDNRKWMKKGWEFFHEGKPCPVRFVGVWDTVGALGVPDDLELLNLLDRGGKWRFHDTELGSHISTARHAMAMNEQRASFTVTRWTNARSHPDALEVWFPGVHSNVGGGYSNTDLSDGSLGWMMDHAAAAGLVFRKGVQGTLRPDPCGVLHNSYKGAFTKLRSRPRAIDAMVPGNKAKFHSSAWDRHKKSPISHDPFRPTIVLGVGQSHTVDVFAGSVWNDTGVHLASGHHYLFSSTGQWKDSKDACDWNGTEDGRFTLGDVMRAGGSLFGKIEGGVKKLTRNASSDFLLTKRVENFRWFSLVGAIANDSGKDAGVPSKVPNDGSPDPHEYVSLSGHTTNPLVVTRPGYLYCFPNDVWALYGNNRGSVKLTIRRVK